MLVDASIEALDGTIDEAMMMAWVDGLVEATFGALDVALIMALIMALDESLDEAMVTSSRASLKCGRGWLACCRSNIPVACRENSLGRSSESPVGESQGRCGLR